MTNAKRELEWQVQVGQQSDALIEALAAALCNVLSVNPSYPPGSVAAIRREAKHALRRAANYSRRRAMAKAQGGSEPLTTWGEQI
jgi:hypothetical protein